MHFSRSYHMRPLPLLCLTPISRNPRKTCPHKYRHACIHDLNPFSIDCGTLVSLLRRSCSVCIKSTQSRSCKTFALVGMHTHKSIGMHHDALKMPRAIAHKLVTREERSSDSLLQRVCFPFSTLNSTFNIKKGYQVDISG